MNKMMVTLVLMFVMMMPIVNGIDITNPHDEPPVARITEPKEDVVYYREEPIHFDSRSSYDNDTGVLSVLWFSDRDGQLGDLVVFDRELSAGNHLITLYVSDGNATSNTNVTITVRDGPGPQETDTDEEEKELSIGTFFPVLIAVISIIYLKRRR